MRAHSNPESDVLKGGGGKTIRGPSGENNFRTRWRRKFFRKLGKYIAFFGPSVIPDEINIVPFSTWMLQDSGKGGTESFPMAPSNDTSVFLMKFPARTFILRQKRLSR